MKSTFRKSLLAAAVVCATALPCHAGWVASRLGLVADGTLMPQVVNGSGQIAGQTDTGRGADRIGHAALYSQGQQTDLDTRGLGPDAMSFAISLSGNGLVLLSTDSRSTGDPGNYFVSDGGRLRDLGLRAYGLNSPTAFINNAGVVAGTAYFDAGPRAFIDYNGQVKMLAGSGNSTARDLNNAGQVVGSYASSADSGHPFLYDANGQFIDLGTLGGRNGRALAINENGLVVGEATLAGDSSWHAAMWVPLAGRVIDLGTLDGGTYSMAKDVNDNGDAVGNSSVLVDGVMREHAFLYTEGTMRDLGTLGGRHSEAMQINNLGQVLGRSERADRTREIDAYFVYADGLMTDIADLVDDLGITTVIRARLGDNGYIAGYGRDTSGNGIAFLLRPGTAGEPPGNGVPEPATWALGLMALAALRLTTRRAMS